MLRVLKADNVFVVVFKYGFKDMRQDEMSVRSVGGHEAMWRCSLRGVWLGFLTETATIRYCTGSAVLVWRCLSERVTRENQRWPSGGFTRDCSGGVQLPSVVWDLCLSDVSKCYSQITSSDSEAKGDLKAREYQILNLKKKSNKRMRGDVCWQQLEWLFRQKKR